MELKRYIVHVRGDSYHVSAVDAEDARRIFTSDLRRELFPENPFFEDPKDVIVEEEKDGAE